MMVILPFKQVGVRLLNRQEEAVDRPFGELLHSIKGISGILLLA